MICHELRQLAPVVQMLGNVWLKELTPEFAEVWNTTIAGVTPDLIGEAAVVVSSDQIEELATTYCRLFVGPGESLPLIQSIWDTGQRTTAATASMQTYFDRLSQTLLAANEPSDHFGHQLWLFGRLLAMTPDDVQESTFVVREYSLAHLQWSNELLNRVESSDSGVYRQAAKLTRLLLETIEGIIEQHS